MSFVTSDFNKGKWLITIAHIKSLFNNKCYRQGGQSASRFSLVMRELWGSITTEERAEICRRMTEGM